jgi:hypothetical protein
VMLNDAEAAAAAAQGTIVVPPTRAQRIADLHARASLALSRGNYDGASKMLSELMALRSAG